MNKVSSLILLIGLFFSITFHLHADPLVQFPSGSAAWTINVADSHNKSSASMGSSDLAKVDVTQNDRFRCSLITFRNGKSRASWDVPGSNIILTEDSRGTPFITPPTRYFSIPFLPSAFSWLSSDLLQGKDPINYQNKLCFHYKGPAGEAWIDSKTLLPVALDNGVVLASFTFQPIPTTPLILPPKFKEVLDGYQKFMGKPHP